MVDHHARADVRSYFRLPLVDDLRDSVTLLRIEPAADGRVRLHLHRGVNRTSFSLRLGTASEPVWQAVAEPRVTLTAPAAGTAGLTGPETVLADVGEFLAGVVLGDGGVYAWGFEGLLPNDEWVLHLTQLSRLHELLEPARRSEVADDPRVAARMAQVAETSQSHAMALRDWLDQAREIADVVRAELAAALHEQRVQAVLEGLGGQVPEDPQARTNPDLRRITPPSATPVPPLDDR